MSSVDKVPLEKHKQIYFRTESLLGCESFFYRSLEAGEKHSNMSKTAFRNKQSVNQSPVMPDGSLRCASTASLPLFMKKRHVCFSKNAAGRLREGRRGRARMRKMCLHGSWEIPPLFAITVASQKQCLPIWVRTEESRRTGSSLAKAVKNDSIQARGGELVTGGPDQEQKDEVFV